MFLECTKTHVQFFGGSKTTNGEFEVPRPQNSPNACKTRAQPQSPQARLMTLLSDMQKNFTVLQQDLMLCLLLKQCGIFRRACNQNCKHALHVSHVSSLPSCARVLAMCLYSLSLSPLQWLWRTSKVETQRSLAEIWSLRAL